MPVLLSFLAVMIGSASTDNDIKLISVHQKWEMGKSVLKEVFRSYWCFKYKNFTLNLHPLTSF